ncbi:unnamed protein product [Lactuca saligna]|uniref:Uncharacterized protein n=1 Tax=Lactuca saligna TaxID=75948 RepID=A0AA35Z1U8_LACSI|nr:unnamed protein product [Lactuca saligna]
MSSNLHWTSTSLLAIPARSSTSIKASTPPANNLHSLLFLFSVTLICLHHLDDRSDTVAAFVSLARDNDWYGKLIIEEDGDNLLLKLVKEGKPEGQENVASAIGLLRHHPESVEHMIHVLIIFFPILCPFTNCYPSAFKQWDIPTTTTARWWHVSSTTSGCRL